MGTRCVIGIPLKTYMTRDSYHYITVSYDGYIEDAGITLLAFYNTEDKVHELIQLGNLSALGPTIGTKFDFDNNSEYYTRAAFQCVAYHRDRGDDLNIREAKSLRDFSDMEFVYIWKNDRWWYYRYGSHRKLLSNAVTLDHLYKYRSHIQLRIGSPELQSYVSELQNQFRVIEDYITAITNIVPKTYYLFTYRTQSQTFEVKSYKSRNDEKINKITHIAYTGEFFMVSDADTAENWDIFFHQISEQIESDIRGLEHSINYAHTRLNTFKAAATKFKEELNNGN